MSRPSITPAGEPVVPVRVTAPIGELAAGTSGPGGHHFDSTGSFTTTDVAVLEYCRNAGYTIDGQENERPLDVSEVADAKKRGISIQGVAAKEIRAALQAEATAPTRGPWIV